MQDSLGDRMKKNYEDRARYQLLRRTPVIIRVDGNAFHTLTRGFDKPFDLDMIGWMERAATKVAEKLQGFKLGYVQSDEASFLLTDYGIKTEGWFDYLVQKMTPISASMMTAFFNEEIQKSPNKDKAKGRTPVFDSRCFNVPESEISNYFCGEHETGVETAFLCLPDITIQIRNYTGSVPKICTKCSMKKELIGQT